MLPAAHNALKRSCRLIAQPFVPHDAEVGRELPRRSMPIAVFHASPVLHIAHFRNVAITHTCGLLRLDDMRRIGDGYRELKRKNPGGVVAFTVIRPGTPVSDREVLQEAASFMTELRDSLLCASVVIEERGVLSQMLTTVIRGINVVTRHKALTVFANHDDALRATAPHVLKLGAMEETTMLLKHAVAKARVDAGRVSG
jgi:hypothetical protein